MRVISPIKQYDYIFSGAGLAALMTVYRMVVSEKFKGKTILLIDQDLKKSNDRTWCFWEKPQGEFNHLVAQKWKSALFADENHRRILNLNPYEYQMIRGLDFYDFVFETILKSPTVTFLNEKVISFHDDGIAVQVTTENSKLSGSKLFNSIFNPEKIVRQTEYPLLQQHFIGWFIKTKEPVFHPEIATFMDFSVEQKGNTRFMYVLPTSENEALIEYTLFSKDLLAQSEYENEIQSYIQNLGVTQHEIVDKESGNIPMTSYKFWEENTKNIINIGSAGGWTKASTGYTFKNTTKKSKELVTFLQSKTDFTTFHKTNKFWFYDLLLLDILSDKNQLGSSIFASMFRKGNPTVIFKFLDEETSFAEDLKVIWRCPKGLFITALLHRIFNKQKPSGNLNY